MLALKGMATMGLGALAALVVLFISAVALAFTLVCAAPLRLLQAR